MTGRPPWRAVAAFALAAFAGCARQATETSASPTPAAPGSPALPTPIPASPPPVNFHGERVGSHYVYATKQKGAQTVYLLRADSVNAVYNGSLTGRSFFTNPHVTFFGNAGKRLVADAPAGTVVEKDKTVLMTGGVHARSQDGMTLTSDTLRYEDESQLVHGTGHVVVTFPTGEQLQGEAVDWNLRDGQIKVAGAE